MVTRHRLGPPECRQCHRAPRRPHPHRAGLPQRGFPDRELSPEKPLLYRAAPALHVHPATDMLLRYLSPEIDWEFVGLDERWREGVKSVFRNRSPDKNRRNPDPRDATFQLPVAN